MTNFDLVVQNETTLASLIYAVVDDALSAECLADCRLPPGDTSSWKEWLKEENHEGVIDLLTRGVIVAAQGARSKGAWRSI